MSTGSKASVCPECGTELPKNAPAGLCRRCLLAEMLGEEDAGLGTLGDYEILNKIAQGGMGTVYRARQRSLNRDVALKLVHSGRFAGERDRRRFTLEAESAASLDHPNIVPVYETGEADGQLFYSMRLIEGGSLAERREEFREPSAAAGVVEKVARAVHAAHQRGILHRDLKPGNILLDHSGEPQVSDFGLAKQLDDEGSLTLSGEVLGSPAYLAPELSSGRSTPSIASDVYSLGALLYELLAGRPPFAAGTVLETLRLARETEPAPLAKVPAPLDLESICLKCLHKDPAHRYESTARLAEDLARFQRGDPVEARPVGALQRAWRWARRNPRVALPSGIAILLLMALAVGGVLSAVTINRSRNLERDAKLEARQRLAEMTLRQGLDDCANGRLTEGIANFGEAHRIGATGSEVQHSALRLIEGWGASHPEILACQDAAIRHLEVFRDGAELVSIDQDGDIKLIDTRTAEIRLVASLDCEVAFARSDSELGIVAIGTSRGGLALCDLADSGKVKWLVPSPSTGERVSHDSCAFGRGAAAGFLVSSTPTALTVWRLPQGEVVTRREGPGGDLVFSPDGHMMLSGLGWSQAARGKGQAPSPTLWDTTAWEPIASFDMEGRPAKTAGFSPDGRLLAIGTAAQDGGDHLGIWEIATARRLASHSHRNHVVAAQFSPDGSQVLSASRDRTATILNWDSETNSLVPLPKMTHKAAVTLATFSPDGARVITTDEDGAVTVWGARDAIELERLQLRSVAHRLAFQPAMDRLLIGTGTGEILARGLPAAPIGRVPFDPIACVFDTGGEVLYVGGIGGLAACRIEEPAKTLWAFPLPPDTFLNTIALSPDGALIAGAGRDGYARVWETASRTEVAALPHSGPVWDVAFEQTADADTASLLTGCRSDRLIRRWALGDRASATVLGQAEVPAVRATSSGSRIFCAGFRGEIHELDRDLRLKRTFAKSHRGAIDVLSISPDGATLASAGMDFSVWLHSIETGEPTGREMQHTRHVLSCEFTPDGRFLATSCLDGGVRLWDAKTGRLCGTWPGRGEVRANALAIHPDGRYLVAVYSDGSLRRWPIPPKLPDEADSVVAHVERVTRLRWSPDKNQFQKMTAAEWNRSGYSPVYQR